MDPSRSFRPHFLFLVALLLGCWPCCQVGGGYTPTSVTVPGEDGLFVKAEASAGDRSARLEFERTTREVTEGFETRYILPTTHVDQVLRLVIEPSAFTNTIVLAEHNEASSYPTHALAFSPDGERLGYKLGDEPWRVIYLLSRDKAVRSPGEYATLDWAAIPTLDEAFVDVYAAQGLYVRTGILGNDQRLLEWVHAREGDRGYGDRLFELIAAMGFGWDYHFDNAPEPAKARVRERLRAEVHTGAPTSGHWSKAWSTGAVLLDAEADARLAEPGAQALAKGDFTVAPAGIDLASYVAAWARQDPARAAEVACSVLQSSKSPIDNGFPPQLVALATLAAAKAPCAAVEGVAVDACAADVDQLDALVNEVLARKWVKPAVDDPLKDPSAAARLVLAHRAALGQAPPTCPE